VVGLLKRWLSTPGAQAVMTRYGVALAAELKRNPGEPYELLRFGWLAAIEPYLRVDPPLHEFHLRGGIMETACKVFALLPLDEGMHNAATIAAAISYPAYVETADGQKAWSTLRATLEAIVLDPGLFNQRFQARNPHTFETVFQAMPFTPADAQRMLQVLGDWTQAHGLRWT
jgi:hypothetical protein